MDGTILLMDYSAYERERMRYILSKLGDFTAVSVPCLADWQRLSPDVEDTCLIILDIEFPYEKDGFEVLSWIRKNPGTADTPIIVTAKLDRPEQRTSALAYNVSDYIIKPYPASRLENSIRALVKVEREFHYDTSGIAGVTMSFEDFFLREQRLAARLNTPLSILLITAGLQESLPGSETSESDSTALMEKMTLQVRKCIRSIDAVFTNQARDMLVILPCTGLQGAEIVRNRIIQSADSLQHTSTLQCVCVAYPEDGENFKALMESAYKKFSEKELLEKMAAIPLERRKQANRTYNRFNKWF